jgi:hypothetical protein
MEAKRGEGSVVEGNLRRTIQGIVVTDGRGAGPLGAREPRIQAFIWGGKVRPTPTLPFGRWKGAA